MYSAKYEDYRDNVDVLDEYAVGNDEIVRNICCRPRHVNVINRRMEGVNEEPCYSHNLSAAVIGVNNTMSTSFAVPRSPWKLSRWADIDEQDLQLENKPNCYLILGKPGCSSYLLGEQLSKQYQCLHICPRNVLVDDLSQKSPVGKCIDFNMRHYNEIKMNTILPIILKKLESPVVQHRGYVLSGIPLVSANRSDMTFFNHSYSEESVLVADGVIYDLVMNIGKKKQKKKRDSDTSNSSFVSEDTLEDAGEEMNEEFPNEGVEEEDKKIELPTFLLDPCEEHIFLRKCYYGSTTVDLLHQLDTLLKVSMKPDVIIYITCPDEDVVTIRKSKYFDYINESSYIAKNNLAPGNEQRWPNKYELSEYKHPIRHQSINQPKYAVKPPINHSEKSVEQLCRYRNVVKPFLEKKLCDINPSSVINIDGRKSVSHNFYHISARLQMMPVKKVVHIPLPLYLEEADDMEEFWKSVAEKNVIKFGDTLTFNRFPSLWYQRCPVELKKRRSIKGKTKYAAAFYNHVYLLSSSDALISFWKNPRPYLNSALLEPTCRIIVMGTKSSGKSMVSECLSWLLDAPVIDYKTLYNAEKRKKYDTITESVFSDLIPVIQDARLEAWDSSETKRMADLAFWHNTALENLRKYIDAWNKIKKLEEPDSDTKAMKNFLTLKENLQFLPFIDDFDECNNALTEKDLLAFAPENLITTPEMPSVPVLGDPDVTEAINDFIISNDMQKDTEPNFEEIAKITISTIKNIDKESLEQFDTYGKYIIDGFDPNPELWEFLIEAKTLPDIVMILIENREIDDKLMKYYSKLETVRKHHRERYIQVEDPLVKIKFNSLKEIPGAVESLISTTLDIQKLFDDIIAEAIDSRIEEIDDQYEAENTMDEEISTFTQAIEKVRTDWGNTKGKLEETFISLIEVELQTNEKDKTDLTILEEVLRKLRQSFCAPCEPIEGEGEEPVSEEKETPKDLLTFNDPRHLGETGIYCPISFFEYGVLWEGKPELSIKYGNKTHFFSKEECLETFRSDWTKYQFFDKPFKKMPPWRICVMGCVGSGRTTLSKLLAKELGLLHIDFEDAVNNLLMPRHFKKVGRRYENIFTDVSLDEEQVVEFQAGEESGETQSSNVLFNELEMRRMVYDYFEKGTPLLSHLLEKLLNKLWFEHPFVDNGIVVDGFPKVSNDVEVMVNCFCIPDIVIELESSSETALARISEKMFQTWKNQQTLAKNKAKKKFAAKTAAWKEFITSNVVAKVILEDLIFEVVSLCEPQPEQAGEVSELPVDNFLSNAYDAMVEDNPPPVDESEWEDNESALERIQNRLETIYEFDDEGIQGLKDLLMEQKIKTTTIDATKSMNKVFRKALLQLSPLVNRHDLFEQTFVIDNETAENLLLEGYYFVSKFSRMCPVYIYENPKAILNPYRLSRLNGTIFPVVHRTYIYFMHGEDSVRKFRANPLKYITCDTVWSFHLFPLRLAVIGPPKSGKSTLAARLAKHYGLICVSRGSAIRNILENLHWTKLASIINSTISDGGCIEYEHVMSAVQTALIDCRTHMYGFVLDGFPDYPPEAIILRQSGYYPLVVFDLSSNKPKVFDNSQKEIYYDIVKYVPPYPRTFIEYKFSKWSDKAYSIRDFLNGDCQNLVTLNGIECKWKCFEDAKTYIEDIIPKIHYYISNVKSDKVLPVDVMCIDNETLKRRWSSFRNLCPVCLHNKVLKRGDEPVDRKCLIQYMGLFYWICPAHMGDVLRKPYNYLNSEIKDIPEIPVLAKNISPTLVYENGVCIVTYAENLPAQIIATGSYKYAVSYKEKQYLFCNRECLRKFIETPHLYFDITVFKDTKGFPQISLKKLPNIGYLEQSVGELITQACCAVNVLRPKYPGLDIKLSGLLFVGLYLKLHNPLLDERAYSFYKKAYDIYEARSKYIRALGLRMRSMDNPFASYPQCCVGSNHSDSTVCKPATLADNKALTERNETSDEEDLKFIDFT